MSLLDEAKEQVYRAGGSCAFIGLDPDLRAEIEEALEHVNAAAVERALRARKVEIKADTLRRHHKRECRCL